MQIRFKEDKICILPKQQVAATDIGRHRTVGIADSISSGSRCRRAATVQLMAYWRIFAMAIAAVLAFGIPLHASSDYESGKKALEAGQISGALEYWTVAAETGDRRSMLELGRLYLQGLGVPQDYVFSHMWFDLAAARGEIEALGEREAVAEKMTWRQLAEAQERAREWQPGNHSLEPEATVQSGVAESTPVMEEPPPKAIQEAQVLLTALGHKSGVADGVWGPRIGRVYASFLRDAGLPESEILTPQTLHPIRSVAAQQGVQASAVPAPVSGRQTAANLHDAVLAGDLDGLKSALAAGADVNARGGSGLTPLMQAANKGYVLMVEPILAAPKVDIDAQAADGTTALFIAAVHGHKEIIELLMKTGANVNIPGPKGKTAVKLGNAHYGEPTSDDIRKHEPAIQALIQGISYAVLQREREEREKLMKTLSAGKEFQDCDTCPKMVVVPQGTFTMGSPASEEKSGDWERPQHQVAISNPFAVGKYEVTREQFEKFVEATGYDASSSGCWYYDEGGDWWQFRQQNSWRKPGFSQSKDHPVACVSWHDAQAYVSWLSRNTGEQYRLLSESEWEYVARAGTTGPFHFGSTISTNQANYDGGYTYGGGSEGVYRKKTVSVGSFPANSFGLHDVHGNVWEWVEDCWHENYQGAPQDGSAWITGGDCEVRVLRGGSWYVKPRNLRSAFRYRVGTGSRSYSGFGFRVARTLTP